jgi:hypothetical protein
VDENPKDGWGAFARALGNNRGESENASEVSSTIPGAGVGIVVADSVNDRPPAVNGQNGQQPHPQPQPQAQPQPQPEEAVPARSGWTSVKAKSVGRIKSAVTASGGPGSGAAGDDAPIPRSRLGRSRSTEPGRAPRVRRARLKIVNVDPWSMMKVSFLFSVALGLVFLVAVALLWTALDVMGVFSSVNHTVSDVSGGANSSSFNVSSWLSLPRVMGMATILALIDTIVITAMTTLAAYLYNLSTDLVGGVEMTFAEEE